MKCFHEPFSSKRALNDMNANLPQVVGRAVRDDLDLVHATQGGDVSAFEELVERYDRKLLVLRNTLRTIAKTRKTWSKRPS